MPPGKMTAPLLRTFALVAIGLTAIGTLKPLDTALIFASAYYVTSYAGFP